MDFPISQRKYLFWRSFFKMYFRRRLLQPEAPSSKGDPRSNLEVFCHEATLQECQKSRKLRLDNSVRPDLAHAGPRKLRTPHTSVSPKPPQLQYGSLFSVFLFSHYWTPIGAIMGFPVSLIFSLGGGNFPPSGFSPKAPSTRSP